jgi:ribosome-binding protein aMBF1 (putative translation factor)
MGSMALPTVSQDLRIAIAQARQAKGLSQKDLAAKLMIPAKVTPALLDDYSLESENFVTS